MSTKPSPTELRQQPDSTGGADRSNRKDSDDEFSLLDLLLILAARRRTIGWTTLAFTIAAIIVSLILPVSYTANVTLLPPDQKSSMGSLLASQLGALGGVASLSGSGLGLKNPNEMFVAMLRSRTVEDAMIARFDLKTEYRKTLQSDARRAFESHAKVTGDGKDGLIHISIEDRDPNRAAELANGYVEEFRSLSEHMAVTEASQRRLFFENQLEKAKDNLAGAEQSLKETEQRTGLIELDSQARALIQSATSLRAQITVKEMQVQGMESYATGENAALVQARNELNSLKSQLAKLGGSYQLQDGEIIVPKGKMTEAGLEYVRKVRDVKYYEAIFDILARQFEIAKLDEAKEGSVIQVVDKAVPPDKRSFPKRAIIVICATVVGFFFGILLCLVQSGIRSANEDPVTATKLMELRKSLRFRRS
jgi:tyrosine-protein kinase Etk/Wzc